MPTTPLVSAIVSSYAAERFMQGCLEDLAGQTLAADIEIIVIDSGSPQAEGAICARFAAAHPRLHLVYLRTEREGLYAAWNRGIQLARGKYVTSANTDDRHSADAFEKLATTLDRTLVTLAYADHAFSTVENETLAQCLSRDAALARCPDFSLTALMRYCICGPQPLWRRSIHERHGWFDESFKVAGDYEFWLRIATTETMVHVPEVLGSFFRSAATLSGSGNRGITDQESLRARLRWIDARPYRAIDGLRAAVAQELFGQGYQYVSASQPDDARELLRAACGLAPWRMRYWKTWLLRGVLRQMPSRP